MVISVVVVVNSVVIATVAIGAVGVVVVRSTAALGGLAVEARELVVDSPEREAGSPDAQAAASTTHATTAADSHHLLLTS